MAALNQDIERAQNQLSTVKADVKRVRGTLTALDAKPRVSDLERDIGRLEAERDAVQTNLEGSQEPPITVEDRNKLEQEWKQWQRHAATRRRICRDLWGQCTEGLPENTSAHELWVSDCSYQERARAADTIARSLWDLKGRSRSNRR